MDISSCEPAEAELTDLKPDELLPRFCSSTVDDGLAAKFDTRLGLVGAVLALSSFFAWNEVCALLLPTWKVAGLGNLRKACDFVAPVSTSFRMCWKASLSLAVDSLYDSGAVLRSASPSASSWERSWPIVSGENPMKTPHSSPVRFLTRI